ncbi:hypothetical protein [Chryseobacterium sp.]|uniref:hypothetical protein n=1 Tax=Chryseobacterium sp. TaxID=1871047 RepID=UPI003219A13A
MYLRKKNYKIGSPILNFTEYQNRFDFNEPDLGDIIDTLGTSDIHPISFAAEQLFNNLIDQKVDEAVSYYLLTGQDYGQLFKNHHLFTKNEKIINEISWYDINFLNEILDDNFENIVGFNYDLVLQKYADNYWRVLIEVDSN